jgi:hypothetical protein
MRPPRLSLSLPVTLLVVASCAKVGDGDGGGDTEPRGSCELPASHEPPSCGSIAIEDRDIEIASCEDFDYAELPDGCWKLTGTLTITGQSVTSVARLAGLKQVGGLILEDTGLVTFDSGAEVKVRGGIVARDNPELADLSSLAFEDQLDGFILEDNPHLESIGGLTAVDTLVGKAIISKNRRLTRVELAARTIGSLTITDNLALVDVAVPNLDSIGEGEATFRYGDVKIERNPLLTAFAMPRLRTVAGTLSIVETGLSTLGTFGAGLVVDWDVAIKNNMNLTDVGEVSRARSVDGTIEISDNGLLPCQTAREVGCCVEAGGFIAEANALPSCTTSGAAWCKSSWGFQCHH